MKQKAITNHEKAIKALEKCIEIDDEPIVLYSELAKNYLALKVYDKAEEYFKKVINERPSDRYILESLYKIYFAQGDYAESTATLEKLIIYDSLFKEQLANLYFLEKRYDEALSLVDELEEELGTDAYRKQLRKKITSQLTDVSGPIKKLNQKIKENPKEEQHYLNLIFLYSKENRKEEAFEVAQQLLKAKPNSEIVHLALYKFYLDDEKIEEAVVSMKKVLTSTVVDTEAKNKMMQDFLGFIQNNPEYEPQLLEVSTLIANTVENSKIFSEIGTYYYNKNEKELALNFFEKGLQENINDLGTLKRLLTLQLDLGRFEKAKLGSELALEIYPSQAELYLLNGKALLSLQKHEEALESLSMGVDFVIDNTKLEADFYTEMAKTYEALGDLEKSAEYSEKSSQLQKNNGNE